MDARSPQSALIVRPPFTVVPYKSDPVNLGESFSRMVAVHGLQEPLDEDLRGPRASNTQRRNRVPVIVVSLWTPIPRRTDILWLESTFCQRVSIHQSSFFCGRDPCRQSPFFCENVAPPVEELQFDDVRRKVHTFVTGRFAILVETLCALLSSLLVTIYPPRRAKKRRGYQCGRAEGSLPREEGGDHCMPFPVLQQGKKRVMLDDCDLSCTLEKDRVSRHRWLKSAEKECFSYMDTGNDTDDRGPNFMKNKLRGAVGLFDRLLPGCMSGWVYPVSHPRVTRAGTGPGPRTHPSPQPLSSADTQWPPDSMHDTPWTTFRQELYRLGTFLNLPQDFPVSPLRLAQAGFLRLANGSIVCFFCGLIRNEWSSHESPLAVHRQLRPDCPMMTGVSCDNVSVQSDDQLSQTMQRLSVQSGAPQTPSRNGLPNGDVSEDGSARALQAGAQAVTTLGAAGGRPSGSVDQNASGANPQQARRQPPRLGLMGGAPSSATPGRPAILDGTAQPDPPAPEVQAPPRAEGDRQVVTYKDLGILTDSPRRPDMATVDSRLVTYREWPDTRRPTPLQLVEAGFYYAGYSDCGRCFFCGGGLTNWEPTDDPWVAHARCFPTCGYVIQSQGHEFVNIVTELSAQTDRQPVSVAEVAVEITRRRVGDPSPDVRADPAVSSAVHSGFNQQAAEAAAHRLLSQGQQLSVVSLMDVLEQDGAEAAAAESAAAISDDSPQSFAQAATGEICGAVVISPLLSAHRHLTGGTMAWLPLLLCTAMLLASGCTAERRITVAIGVGNDWLELMCGGSYRLVSATDAHHLEKYGFTLIYRLTTGNVHDPHGYFYDLLQAERCNQTYYLTALRNSSVTFLPGPVRESRWIRTNIHGQRYESWLYRGHYLAEDPQSRRLALQNDPNGPSTKIRLNPFSPHRRRHRLPSPGRGPFLWWSFSSSTSSKNTGSVAGVPAAAGKLW